MLLLQVLRGGKLPKHPCIPERLFQLMNEKCFLLRPRRAKVAELRDLLQEQHSKIEGSYLSVQRHVLVLFSCTIG